MQLETEISSVYRGPYYLHEDVTKALEILAHHLSIEVIECETHSVLAVQNFNGHEVLEAVAIYLVSAISQNIEANLQIRKALFNEESMSRELERDVISVVGERNVDDHFKKMVRDPWLWEGISHMFVHLARFDTAFHPSGRVLVKTSIKHDVHDHGLDVIAIYEADNIGISAGECKAYLDDPSRGITDASKKLSEVDANIRDIEIRSAVNQLRCALAADVKEKLAGAFWKNERCYLPFVCCDQAHACNWTRNRLSLQRLAVPLSRKFLFPLSLSEAREKFDGICNIMWVYVNIKE